MITLEQAIKLATEAHEGQLRKMTSLTTDKYNILISSLNTEEIRVSPVSDQHFMINRDGTNIWIEKFSKSGLPLIQEATMRVSYITHPLAVMEMMDTEEEKIVAVLHDVVENGEFKLNYIRTSNEEDTKHWISCNEQNYYITHSMYDALFLLTKTNKMSYLEYIESITLSKLATKVKLADIFHNMSCEPSEHAKQKYLEAIPVLLKGI